MTLVRWPIAVLIAWILSGCATGPYGDLIREDNVTLLFQLKQDSSMWPSSTTLVPTRIGNGPVVNLSVRETGDLSADRIVVLHQGKVAEQGTHEELNRGQGLYSKLHALHFTRSN